MDTAKLRRWLAAATLGIYSASQAASTVETSGYWTLLFGFFAVAVGVAAVGVALRSLWARWLGIGIGVTGLLDVALLTWARGVWPGVMLFALMPLGVLLFLIGPRMAQHFASAPWTELWQRRDARLWLLKLAIVLSVPAVAGLLRYAILESWWIDDTDRAVALSSAALFAAGAIATAAKRSVGPILWLAPAFASFGLATESWFRLGDAVHGRWDDGLVSLCVSGWLPAVATTLLAFAVLAKPMWRFLQRRA